MSINTASEIRGLFGRYSNPTIYMDRRACGEQQLSAMACSPLHHQCRKLILQNAKTPTAIMQRKRFSDMNGVTRFSSPTTSIRSAIYGIAGRLCRWFVYSLCSRYSALSKLLATAVSAARAYAGGDHGTPAQRDYYTRWGYTNGVSKCFNNLPRVVEGEL